MTQVTTSPERYIKNGNETLVLTHDNTTVIDYEEPYSHLDHIRVIKGGLTMYLFGRNELANELYHDNYAYAERRYPTSDVAQRFEQWQESIVRELSEGMPA